MRSTDKKPNFFIVGAPKCGTTSFFHYLSMHPEIFAPAVKEPHFFCEDFPGIRFVTGLDEYHQLFLDAGDRHLAIGEASPAYMYSTVAIERIRQYQPSAKLIVMLRNPIELVYSLHSQQLSTLNEDQQDFATAWALQGERLGGKSIPGTCLEPFFLQYGEIGQLGRHLKRVYSVFPEEQVQVIFLDDLKVDVGSVYARTIEFLGLSPYQPESFPTLNPNKVNQSRFVARLTERGAGRFRLVSRLKKLVGLRNVSLRQKLRQINQRNVRREPLPSAVRRQLADFFEADIRELERVTGRNMDTWLRDS